MNTQTTQSFNNQVAVITGAASGIGRGLANKAAQLGMRVAIADVDASGLQVVEQELRAHGAEVLARRVDVTRFESVQELADAVDAAFGGVHLLFNNAGVLVDGISWQRSVEDWRWSFDVNVMGVIHGIKAFVPRMLAARQAGVVINTASMGGLLSGAYLGPYMATKHAVVSITETLHFELLGEQTPLRAAVLCPGEVATGIWHSERLRTDEYGEKGEFSSQAETATHDFLTHSVAKGISPQQLAELAFDGIAAGKFWLFSHPDSLKTLLAARVQSIMDESVPQPPQF
jgi:NAD(P)-dependent dehydrogenase (short-subunit alcohol dehydrogenase family)